MYDPYRPFCKHRNRPSKSVERKSLNQNYMYSNKKSVYLNGTKWVLAWKLCIEKIIYFSEAFFNRSQINSERMHIL